jgi:hypothetical protein
MRDPTAKGIAVQVRAGLGWPEVWKGRLLMIPRVGDDIDVNDSTCLTVHRVQWVLPGKSQKAEVVIYAK